MENTKANTVLNHCNDVYFKYTLSREDEGSCLLYTSYNHKYMQSHCRESLFHNAVKAPEMLFSYDV